MEPIFGHKPALSESDLINTPTTYKSDTVIAGIIVGIIIFMMVFLIVYYVNRHGWKSPSKEMR